MAIDNSNKRDVFPVVEERPSVRKTQHATGVVRVRTRVREDQETVSADLRGERFEIERIPQDRFVDGPIPDRREGETLVLSVVEEVVVVETRFKLVEEVRITRHETKRHWEETVPVRRTDVVTERIEAREADRKS